MSGRNTALGVLRDALEQLQRSPDAWLRKEPFVARDGLGLRCRPWDATASRWGLMALLGRTQPSLDVRMEAVDWLKRALGVPSVPNWEEWHGTTRANVLAAVERAIALAAERARP